MGTFKSQFKFKAAGVTGSYLAAAFLIACSGTSDTGSQTANTNASHNSTAAVRSPTRQTAANSIGEAPSTPKSGGPKATPQFSDAHEDSTLLTTMNPQGQVFQVRVFKGHPQLAKVESTWTGPTERQIKFFLRSGETKEITNGAAADIKDLTTSQLLEMAGVKQDRLPGSGSATTGSKKNKQLF